MLKGSAEVLPFFYVSLLRMNSIMQLKKVPCIFVLLIAFYSTRLFGADAPITYAPVLTVMATGPVAVPVTVTGFAGVGSMTLSLEYDPSIMSYVSFIKNPAFGSSFLVGNNPGVGGKMIILIQWFGTPVTLASGSTICTLNFNYTASNSNGTLLKWFDNGPSCQYTDANTAVLNDIPGTYFYHNGSVAPPLVAVSISPSANPVCSGSTVNFAATPVNGGITPSYQWKINGVNAGTNNQYFSFIPANNDVVSCVLTSSASFVSGNPAVSNLVVMTTIPLVVANFSADNLTPAKNDTVSFTDISTGGVTSWTWSFDKPGFLFVDGTTNHSQNPHVKFSDGGYWSVTLETNNSCFSHSLVKSGYILVGLPGLWLGTASPEWSNGSNWDNTLVPGSVTSVVIPSSAANWPVFNGDLTIGIQCSRLTLNGTTSRMTITGNLIIP